MLRASFLELKCSCSNSLFLNQQTMYWILSMQLYFTWECNGIQASSESQVALSRDGYKLVLKYISESGTKTNRMSKYSTGSRLCLITLCFCASGHKKTKLKQCTPRFYPDGNILIMISKQSAAKPHTKHFWGKVEAQASRHRVNTCKPLVLKSIYYWHPPPRNYPAHLHLLSGIHSKAGF